MSEEKATPSSGSAASSASARKSGLSSRRRSTPKPGATTRGPALAPERDDSYQRFPRIWPD